MRFGLLAAAAFLIVLGCRRDPPLPQEIWMPAAFAAIDPLTDDVKISRLRETELLHSDIELRVWIGFGMNRLEGLRITRRSNEWSAVYVKEDNHGRAGSTYETQPSVSWDSLWDTLTRLGLLTLPDQSELKTMVHVLDGVSYVVEYIVGGDYRAYMYLNPHDQRGPEAKQIVEIVATLRRELIQHLTVPEAVEPTL